MNCWQQNEDAVPFMAAELKLFLCACDVVFFVFRETKRKHLRLQTMNTILQYTFVTAAAVCINLFREI